MFTNGHFSGPDVQQALLLLNHMYRPFSAIRDFVESEHSILPYGRCTFNVIHYSYAPYILFADDQ